MYRIVRGEVATTGWNSAEQDFWPLTKSEAEASPWQSPLQPVKRNPSLGEAVRLTRVGSVSVTVQAEPPAPQVRPPPVTVPLAGAVIVSVYKGNRPPNGVESLVVAL